jgi:AcrR family transcriptional regulator
VARRLFEERGYHDTTLDAIARELRIRAPSLLYHFESKEDLLDAVLGEFYAEGRERVLEALASPGSPGNRLERVVEVIRDLWQQNGGLLRIAITELMKPDGVGRDHVFEMALPTLKLVEQVLHDSVSPSIPANAPVQAATMTVLAAHILRLAMGDAGKALWGPEENLSGLQAILFRGLQEWPAKGAAPRGRAGSRRARATANRKARGGHR